MALVVLAFGIYALVDGAAFADLVNAASPDATVNLYDTAVVLIIIVATFIMIVAFFGCCGAWKVNTIMYNDIHYSILSKMGILYSSRNSV